MPVNPQLKALIDNSLTANLTQDQFHAALLAILVDLFSLGNTAQDDLAHTAAYLAYRISSTYMRHRSVTSLRQGQYAAASTAAFQHVYNSPMVVDTLRAAQPETGLRTLLNLYNFHAALTRNGWEDDQARNFLSLSAPLTALYRFVQTAFVPWQAALRVRSGGLELDTRARIAWESGHPVMYPIIDIGRADYTGLARNVSVATWNMQGETGDGESKWTTEIKRLALANDIVLLQEVGFPTGSVLVGDQTVLDQFGVERTVQVWRRNYGTQSKPAWYHIYFYNTNRVRVNLAIVVPENSPLTVRDVVIISDGPGEPDEDEYRPALGIRIIGNPQNDLFQDSADSVYYTFHAAAGGGGHNTPRVVREVAWHTPVTYVVAGDFNRDPRPPTPQRPNRGPWMSPQGLAIVDLADQDTHGGATPAMLDYAVHNGTIAAQGLGAVRSDLAASDHWAVLFTFLLIHFSPPSPSLRPGATICET